MKKRYIHILKVSIIIIFLLILIFYSNCVIAAHSWYDSFKQKALELRGSSDLETINNIKSYVRNNTLFEFSYTPKSLYRIWTDRLAKYMKGDCTDYSTLIKEMLAVNNITTQYQHGYCCHFVQRSSNVVKVCDKHDWLLYNKTIVVDSLDYCVERKVSGFGIW